VDAKFASYSTTTQMNAAIEAAKSSITSTVSSTYATKSEVTTVSGKVTSLETWKAEASQKITKDGIVATVGNYYSTKTDIDTAISGIEVGGRNLWLKTKEYDGSTYAGWVDNNDGNRRPESPYTTVNGFGVQRIVNAWRDVSQRVPIESDTEYTLSAWIKWESTVGSIIFYDNASKATGTNVSSQVGTDDYKRVSITFNSGSATVSTCRFECSSNTPFYIYGLKLEKGNKATDWTPAPEDTVEQISAVETIATQTSEKFNWLVKSGTSASDFTLTDRTATLIAQTINLNGNVKVNGDMLVDGTITGKKVNLQDLFSQNITATNMTIEGDSVFKGEVNAKKFSIADVGMTVESKLIAYYSISVSEDELASSVKSTRKTCFVINSDNGMYCDGDLYVAGAASLDFAYLDSAEIKDCMSYNATIGHLLCQYGTFWGEMEFKKPPKLYNLTHVTSGGHLVFEDDGATLAYLSSSSKRYKDIQRDLTVEDVKCLYGLPIKLAKYKDDYLSSKDERYGKSMPMFVAEDVEEVLPIAANHNADGTVEDWNERIMIPAMMKLIQEQNERITQLETQVQALLEKE
jgi:hypothetical protein